MLLEPLQIFATVNALTDMRNPLVELRKTAAKGIRRSNDTRDDAVVGTWQDSDISARCHARQFEPIDYTPPA